MTLTELHAMLDTGAADLAQQGRLSPACRRVSELIQEIIGSWGHQLRLPGAAAVTSRAAKG